VEELKDAILSMIVERFDGRTLSWEDATMALPLAAFEIKQVALFAPAVRSLNPAVNSFGENGA
jgi:hypothetical protein